MIFQLNKSINQPVVLPEQYGVHLFLKREDNIHPFISGNKYRKLKYNIEEAKKSGVSKLLTFGGAYSNHIAAVAFAGQEFGFETIGIIRGDELEDKIPENPTLLFREKHSMSFTEKLKAEFNDFYLLPEGGTNALAVKGCEEILTVADNHFDYVCCAIGTGGTISGIINSSKDGQQILGFPALKGSFLKEDISRFVTKKNWSIINEYHFGGYAKINIELIEFINQFKKENNIQLDPVYTGKMMFGIFDLLEKGFFKRGSRILTIHTGGLQGIPGMNNVLIKKKMPIIV